MMMMSRATTPAWRRATRETITIVTMPKTTALWRQRGLRIGDGNDTASCEAARMQQPAGTNKKGGLRRDTLGGCTTKGDMRLRQATTCNKTTRKTCDTTTSRQTRGKQKERHQRTRGNKVAHWEAEAESRGQQVEALTQQAHETD